MRVTSWQCLRYRSSITTELRLLAPRMFTDKTLRPSLLARPLNLKNDIAKGVYQRLINLWRPHNVTSDLTTSGYLLCYDQSRGGPNKRVTGRSNNRFS